MRTFARLIDLLAEAAGWAFFAIGGMLAWEVVMRYFFNAPTIWAEELSRLTQVWATWLAAAYLLKTRRLIAVGLVFAHLPPFGRRLVEAFNLLVIAAFSAIGLYYSLRILADTIALGRRTATMLDLPLWLLQAAVPVGLALLLLQCVVEWVRVLRGDETRIGFSHEAE